MNERDIDTPKWLRELVLARDGFRCRCCGSRVSLMAHHIEWLSARRRTEAGNLLTLCSQCHARVHEKLLVILRRAANDVRFLDRRGEELARWVGGVGPRLSRVDGARAPLDRPLAGAPLDRPLAGAPLDRPLAGAPLAPERGLALSLEELPEEVDSEWWCRNSRHFQWNDRRGAYRYEGGIVS
ncbi:MAG: HNH endonuclease signature motif containing protein [Planctomycetota bacterium]